MSVYASFREMLAMRVMLCSVLVKSSLWIGERKWKENVEAVEYRVLYI